MNKGLGIRGWIGLIFFGIGIWFSMFFAWMIELIMGEE